MRSLRAGFSTTKRIDCPKSHFRSKYLPMTSKRKPLWRTKMWWFGPFVDITGRSLSIRSAWRYRLLEWCRRVWDIRKSHLFRRLVADSFFTLWVATDLYSLYNGTTRLLPLNVLGGVFGSALVVSEWTVFYEDYRDSRPLHVLWQPRVMQSPQQPNLYVHIESKNLLPFEIRCTFVDESNHMIAGQSYPTPEQQFVPGNNIAQQFFYPTQIPRTALIHLRRFQLVVEITPLLSVPAIRETWRDQYVIKETIGRFEMAGSSGGGWTGVPCRLQRWFFPEDQDQEWRDWMKGV